MPAEIKYLYDLHYPLAWLLLCWLGTTVWLWLRCLPTCWTTAQRISTANPLVILSNLRVALQVVGLSCVQLVCILVALICLSLAAVAYCLIWPWLVYRALRNKLPLKKTP